MRSLAEIDSLVRHESDGRYRVVEERRHIEHREHSMLLSFCREWARYKHSPTVDDLRQLRSALGVERGEDG